MQTIGPFVANALIFLFDGVGLGMLLLLLLHELLLVTRGILYGVQIISDQVPTLKLTVFVSLMYLDFR